MGPFEVPKELVSRLDDEQLRKLLEGLLIAEANARGISGACNPEGDEHLRRMMKGARGDAELFACYGDVGGEKFHIKDLISC